MAKHFSHGADVEQLDDIAVGLRRQSERIADAGGRGAVMLEKLRAVWEGPDFENFAGSWRTAHRDLDDAEAAVRTYSRKLLEESESQRHASGMPSGGGGGHGGGGGGPAFERVIPADNGALFLDEPIPFEVGGPFGYLDIAERAGAAAPFVTGGPAVLLGQVPSGGEELVYQLPGGPEAHVPVADLPFVGELTPVLPGLPGGEDLPLLEGGVATEPAYPWTGGQIPSGDGGGSDAPDQVPTTEGAHLTTGADSAGQRSVAFDPMIAALSGGFAADGSQMAGWLGEGPDLLPWNR
ncbi:WXG100 family type VII secretion target [Janibacter limosus]|uniref:WXG100 family type VII secretion target n=1 Tax=Janibacter limosus TaxID=53458 RepID=UPI000832613A|nr:hypothetical protein [Janibacter limosus]